MSTDNTNKPLLEIVKNSKKPTGKKTGGTGGSGGDGSSKTQKFGEYIRPDELHLGFNFRLAETEFSAESVREAVENSLAAVAEVGGVPTWTLSNHDVEREVSRRTRTS